MLCFEDAVDAALPVDLDAAREEVDLAELDGHPLHAAGDPAGHREQQQGIAVARLGRRDREVAFQVCGGAGSAEVALRALHGMAHVEHLRAPTPVGRHVQHAAVVDDPGRLRALVVDPEPIEPRRAEGTVQDERSHQKRRDARLGQLPAPALVTLLRLLHASPDSVQQLA